MDKQYLYDLLVRSLDCELEKKDQQILDEAMSSFPELREQQEQLLHMRALLSAAKVAPSREFTENVLSKIESPGRHETSFSTNMVRLLPKVAAACILFFLTGLGSIYLGEGNISTDSIVGVSDISPEEAYAVLAEN